MSEREKRQRTAETYYSKEQFKDDCIMYTEQDYVDFCNLIQIKCTQYLSSADRNLKPGRNTFYVYVEKLPLYELIGIGV